MLHLSTYWRRAVNKPVATTVVDTRRQFESAIEEMEKEFTVDGVYHLVVEKLTNSDIALDGSSLVSVDSIRLMCACLGQAVQGASAHVLTLNHAEQSCFGMSLQPYSRLVPLAELICSHCRLRCSVQAPLPALATWQVQTAGCSGFCWCSFVKHGCQSSWWHSCVIHRHPPRCQCHNHYTWF